MCAGCGAPPPGIDWFSAGVPDSAAGRLQARTELASAASALLGPAGVKVSHYPGASTLSVRSTTGATVTIRQLAELAPAAHKLTKASFDPLDPATIARHARTGSR